MTADDFARLLREAGVETVVDVRRYPGSRRHPQFNRGEMEQWLPAEGIAYRWEERLGGRREPHPHSVNRALRNRQFRAYADHMTTGEFAEAIDELLTLAEERIVAVMCSESVWWRCHRRLVADYLVLVEGRDVRHLLHDGRLTQHDPTPGARIGKGRVLYDAPTLPLEG